MLNKSLFSSTKFVLITIVSIFGVTLSHLAVTNAAAPTGMNMMSHGTQSNVQCQSSCTTTLPSKKEELLQIREDDKDPILQPYYARMLAGGLLAALFLVKRSASFTSSWRPPDLLKIYGHYILYA